MKQSWNAIGHGKPYLADALATPPHLLSWMILARRHMRNANGRLFRWVRVISAASLMVKISEDQTARTRAASPIPVVTGSAISSRV